MTGPTDLNANAPREPNQEDRAEPDHQNYALLGAQRQIDENAGAIEALDEQRQIDETIDQANTRKFKEWRYQKCLKDMRQLKWPEPDPPFDDNLYELVEWVNNKAKESDDKAVDMVKRGALIIYTEILNIGATNEQTLAAIGIGIFSWTCYERTNKEFDCREGEFVSFSTGIK